MRVAAGLLCPLGLIVSSSMAQPIETIQYSIEWDQDVLVSGTNTGAVYATVIPDIGTQTVWNSKPGSGQVGTIMAFTSSIMDFVNVQNGLLGKLEWSVPDEFNLAKSPGDDDGNGGIHYSQCFQYGYVFNPNPNVNQTVKILDLKWTLEGSPTVGSVLYKTVGLSTKVWLDVGLPSGGWVGETAAIINAEGGFALVPTPASLAMLAMAGSWSSRRRRCVE